MGLISSQLPLVHSKWLATHCILQLTNSGFSVVAVGAVDTILVNSSSRASTAN